MTIISNHNELSINEKPFSDKKPLLIGIAGRKGSGKSTVATFLGGVLNGRSVIQGFAHPMKLTLYNLFNVDNKYFEDPLCKEKIIPGFNISGRKVMQLMGTEFLRNMVDKDFFIKVKASFIEETKQLTDIFIIDDVRFNNEAEWIRENNGHIIHVYNTSKDAAVEEAARVIAGEDTHSSEQGIVKLPQDGYIFNTSTKLFLAHEILEMIKKLNLPF